MIDPGVQAYRKANMQLPDIEVRPVHMRLIKYFIEGKTYVLATTILDQKIPREDFTELYAKRWVTEELFKVLKQTLQLEEFHSKSEHGIKQEIDATTLLWNLSRILGSMADPVIKKSLHTPIFIALFYQLPTMRIESSGKSKSTFFKKNKNSWTKNKGNNKVFSSIRANGEARKKFYSAIT